MPNLQIRGQDCSVAWLTNSPVSPCLKTAPPGNEPYDRPQKEGQEVILDNKDPIVIESYETEKLLDRKITGRGKFITVLLNWLILRV